MPESIVDLLQIPRELVLEFLVTFSRFEYALKRTGFVQGDERGILPDWNLYANHLEAISKDILQPVFDEAAYIESDPPLKQVRVDSKLAWAPGVPEKTRIRSILLEIRTVRNNLFHGGKFPGQYVPEPSRDEQLIQTCLAILNALIALPDPNPVAQHFKPER